MAKSNSNKSTLLYTVQELAGATPEPVGYGLWSMAQAKRIRTLLKKQGRECFLAPVQVRPGSLRVSA